MQYCYGSPAIRACQFMPLISLSAVPSGCQYCLNRGMDIRTGMKSALPVNLCRLKQSKQISPTALLSFILILEILNVRATIQRILWKGFKRDLTVTQQFILYYSLICTTTGIVSIIIQPNCKYCFLWSYHTRKEKDFFYPKHE